MSLTGFNTLVYISNALKKLGHKGNEHHVSLGLPLAVTVAFIVVFVAISAAWATATDTDFSTTCW